MRELLEFVRCSGATTVAASVRAIPIGAPSDATLTA
jgi:hypothetical protein